MPYFTIIIPSFNRAHVIERSIQSVLNQRFSDFEIIVVDDGSTDNTKQVISNFEDSRLRYVYQKNSGVCSARNHGVSEAFADYVTFLDSDDYVTENWLTDFYYGFISNDTDFVFCDMIHVNLNDGSEKRVRATHPYRDQPSFFGFFMSGTFAIKKSLFHTIGGFDSTLKFSEFNEFRYSCMKYGFTKSYTGKIGLIYEASPDGGSKNFQNKIDSNLYIIKKHAWIFKKQPHVLRLYYQNTGVAYSKLFKWTEARYFLYKAYKINPLKLKPLVRLLMTYLPFFDKKI